MKISVSAHPLLNACLLTVIVLLTLANQLAIHRELEVMLTAASVLPTLNVSMETAQPMLANRIVLQLWHPDSSPTHASAPSTMNANSVIAR